MTQWRQFVSFNIEVARKNMYIFQIVILQLFITWQEKSFGYGLLKKNIFWNVFTIGWDACDDQAALEIYRAPFDIFNEFLSVPLKNSHGEWVCRNSERKKILKEAYCALGMNIKDPNSKNVHIFVTPYPSCGRFSIAYSRLRFLFPLGGQMGFFKLTNNDSFLSSGKKYNRSSLLSHENNSRQKKGGPERHVHFYYSNPLLFLQFPRTYRKFIFDLMIRNF